MAAERDTSIRIDGREIGRAAAPYVIAELSANHNGSLDRAMKLIELARDAGVDAVKIQTYRPDTITLDCDAEDFVNRGGLWDGRTLYDLYQEAHLPWEWHEPLFRHARDLGVTIFSSPFDHSAVDLLEQLGAPAYKIASFEILDLPLIARVARTSKPMILSTGMASLEEIAEAVACARNHGCQELVLLKCTSSYPATPENSNVLTIPSMRSVFGCEVGLSDHTLGVGCAVAAIAHGATMVEKHFTADRAEGGVDSAFSMEPGEFRQLVEECGRAWQSLGKVSYGPTPSERASLAFRRSIYVSEDIRAGEVLTQSNIRCVRPGRGLPPKCYEVLLGRKAAKDLKKGTPMSWDLVD
jgi:N-acetylneuraminate synthase